MRQASAFLVLILAVHTYSAPQFITWKDGQIGVNFGGYHAGVGIGGGGGAGGLFAQAGTPHGQSALAGLGGSYGTKAGYQGGLYAGAQAAENVRASAGLGGISGGNSYATGNGFAGAQAGGHFAASSMSGQSSLAGSTGYKVQTFEIPTTVVKETEISAGPVDQSSYSNVKKVHKEIKFETENEVKPLPLSPVAESHVDAKVDIKAEAQPVLIKEVYVEHQPHIIEKTKIRTHYKPHHHHIHKTAYVGGYIGGGADIPPPSYTPIEKRVDIGVEGSGNVGVIDVGAHGHGGAHTTITKEVTVGRNPSFFADIFNIPIATLKAVGTLLSDSAASTKVSVQKSATIQAAPDSDTTSSKHAPSSSFSSSLSDTQVSVETPSVSQIIDGIFSIPINTLGAVNKFLENNVSGRKRIQVQERSAEPVRARLGPLARRRANKVVYVQQEANEAPKPDEAY